MAPRPVISPHDQSATFVELFFDLVFVFGITQVVGLLHHDLNWTGAFHSVLVFWLLWWAWTQFTWALNAADTEHPWIEFGTLAATAVAFFMAVAVPESFEGGALWFAVPYVLVRGIGLTLYIFVMNEDSEKRKAVKTFATASLGGLAAVLMGAFAPENQAMFWSLAVILDFVASASASTGEWKIHPEHFAERHGLIVIIALGEGLIVAAAGLAGAERSAPLLLVGLMSVLITCALWWTYFPVAKPELEKALERSELKDRAKLARDAFSMAHFPMMCGIIAYAVAIEAAVAHPNDPLGTPERIALAAGLLLFVGGLAVALWRTSCSVRVSRVVVSVLTAAVVFALVDVPAVVSLTVAFVGVTVVAVMEERLAERLLAE